MYFTVARAFFMKISTFSLNSLENILDNFIPEIWRSP